VRRFRNWESAVGLVGLTRTATAAAEGTTSRKISNRFGPTSTFKLVSPVRLASGWFKTAYESRCDWVGAHLEDD
jgi:hypothetical protein